MHVDFGSLTLLSFHSLRPYYFLTRVPGRLNDASKSKSEIERQLFGAKISDIRCMFVVFLCLTFFWCSDELCFIKSFYKVEKMMFLQDMVIAFFSALGL